MLSAWCFVGRLHGNPLGDEGVERLVSGLEEVHGGPDRAVRTAAEHVAAEALSEALQSGSLGSVAQVPVLFTATLHPEVVKFN